MKKVLIIAFHHNSSEDVSSIRCRGLAKHLKKFGWEPIVLTAAFETNEIFPYDVHQTNHFNQLDVWKKRFGFQINQTVKEQLNKPTFKNKKTLFDRLLSILIEFIAYPDAIKKGWYPSAMIKAEEILSSTPIDAILSTFSPATCHLIAKDLSQKYNIPWIADFRDLWTQNHYYTYSKFRKYFEKKLEINTLAYSDIITSVSQPFAEKLSELHKNKTIYNIQNGFDPDMTNPGTIVNPQFRIIYTGKIYPGKQDPEPLFIAINDLYNEELIKRDDIKIDFYGDYEKWISEDIARYHLQDIVTLHGKVSRDVIIAEQFNAQLLLLLSWNDPAEKGVIPAKIFEYFAARRPILSMGNTNGGIVKEILDQTQAGVHVSNEGELKDYLLRAYQEYKESGAVQYRGIEAEVMKCSHKEMARKFVEVLENVIKK